MMEKSGNSAKLQLVEGKQHERDREIKWGRVLKN